MNEIPLPGFQKLWNIEMAFCGYYPKYENILYTIFSSRKNEQKRSAENVRLSRDAVASWRQVVKIIIFLKREATKLRQ